MVTAMIEWKSEIWKNKYLNSGWLDEWLWVSLDASVPVIVRHINIILRFLQHRFLKIKFLFYFKMYMYF